MSWSKQLPGEGASTDPTIWDAGATTWDNANPVLTEWDVSTGGWVDNTPGAASWSKSQAGTDQWLQA
ncbi:MAG: hypothetical protein ACR2P6_07565 [Gammaproteobacteria bacterium]